MKGTEIVGRVWSLSIPEREDAFVQAVIDGDAVPWPMVDVKVASPDGRHSGAFQISADYLSIGTTSDFIRIPLTPLSAQRICDILGFSLPTTKMVDLAWKQASVRLAPQPMGPPYDATMGSMARIAEHNARVETQRAGRTGLVRGHKKDVVLTNQLAARPRQVAIYGWHQSNGTPIQSLTLVHTNTYMDYSHGIALIGKTMVLDGGEVDIAEVLSDPELAPLLSDEGVLKVLRQPGVGDSDAPRDKPAPSAPPGEAPPWLQPELSIGARAVEWSLHELSSGVHEEPPGSNAGPRIQEYLAPCVRDGKNLGLTSGNWCAASASAAAFACKLPGETVPHEYRAAGLDMEKDAKSNGSWRAASDALRGAFSPAVGDLVILQRGSKTGSDSWKRHVARVETPPDAEGRYRTIGGNEGAGEWHLSERRFVDPDLLGFIVYPRARDASSPVAIPPATPPGLPAGPVAQRLDIGAPGADSLMFVTSKPSGSGATLIDLATGVFGRPPAFWGRYFSKPSVQPQKDGRVTGEYWPEKETEALLAAGICLLPIARQTKRVNLTQEDGRADGRENAQALVSKVGAAHLGSSGAEIYMFLDIEASDTSPSLSADYFIGWARGLSEGSNGVKIAPCLYMRQADGATVRALNAASARGTQCRAIWMAHWLGRKQYTPTPWRDDCTRIGLDFECPIVAWQYESACQGQAGFDCSQVNPAIDLESDLLCHLPLSPALAERPSPAPEPPAEAEPAAPASAPRRHTGGVVSTIRRASDKLAWLHRKDAPPVAVEPSSVPRRAEDAAVELSQQAHGDTAAPPEANLLREMQSAVETLASRRAVSAPDRPAGARGPSWAAAALLVVTAAIVAVGVVRDIPPVGLWGVEVALLAAFLGIVGKALTGRPLGVLISPERRMNLVRFQAVVWTLLLLSAYIAVVVLRKGQSDPFDVRLDPSLYVLLGVSAASLAGGAVLDNLKRRKIPQKGAVGAAAGALERPTPEVAQHARGLLIGNASFADARVTDMLGGDEIGNAHTVEIGKVVLFLVTALAAGAYALSVERLLRGGAPANITALPGLSKGLVGLLGFAHTVHAVTKAVRRTPVGSDAPVAEPERGGPSDAEVALAGILSSTRKSADLVRSVEQATSAQTRALRGLSDALDRLTERLPEGYGEIGRDATDAITQVTAVLEHFKATHRSQAHTTEQTLEAARRLEQSAQAQERATRQLVRDLERLKRRG